MLEGAGRSKRQRRIPAWLQDAQAQTPASAAAHALADTVSSTPAAQPQQRDAGTSAAADAGNNNNLLQATGGSQQQQIAERQSGENSKQPRQQLIGNIQQQQSDQASLQAYSAAQAEKRQQQSHSPEARQQQQHAGHPQSQHMTQPAVVHSAQQQLQPNRPHQALPQQQAQPPGLTQPYTNIMTRSISPFAAQAAQDEQQQQSLQQQQLRAQPATPTIEGMHPPPSWLTLQSCAVEEAGRTLLVTVNFAGFTFSGRLALVQQPHQPQQQQYAVEMAAQLANSQLPATSADQAVSATEARPVCPSLTHSAALALQHMQQRQQLPNSEPSTLPQAEASQSNAGLVAGLLNRTAEAVRQERLQQQESHPVGAESMPPPKQLTQQQLHQHQQRHRGRPQAGRRQSRASVEAASGGAEGGDAAGRATLALLSAFALQREQELSQQQQQQQRQPQDQPQQRPIAGADSHPVVPISRVRAVKPAQGKP